LGIKDAAGFAERPQGGTFATQQLLHFVQGTGLLDATQAGEDRVEEIQQDQRGVLVIMEFAILSAVTLAGVVMETVQKRPQDFEILETAEIRGPNLGPAQGCHGGSLQPRAETKHSADEIARSGKLGEREMRPPKM
jgi:hypothetical protein